MSEIINLMQGDCLERMKEIPDGSVDMVLTDPPYGMSFQSNYRKEKLKKIEGDTNLNWLDDFISEIYRVASSDSAHYMFCSFHKIDIFKQAIEKKFTVKNILVWEKNNTSMGDLKGNFAPKVEFVIFFQKGRELIRGKRDPNIFRFNRTGNILHPTEKPMDMCEYLLEKFSCIGDTVLDPFMGSGTTGVACVNTGRNFIGIELDPTYFEIAKQRIESA
jgi:site-specific DNA-methyltransferase (adenine-specific)